MIDGDQPATAEVPDAVANASAIEQADVAVTKAVAPLRDSALVRALGLVSELADQPPLISICAATLAWGLVTRNPRLARCGSRMLAAELLATALKTVVKDSVDRTRPKVLVEEGRYAFEPGDSHGHPITSFPSGHTAGAVTVARALARDYPDAAPAAYAAAVAVAAVQVPRCTHYPTDIVAGAMIGLVAEAVVSHLIGTAPTSDLREA